CGGSDEPSSTGGGTPAVAGGKSDFGGGRSTAGPGDEASDARVPELTDLGVLSSAKVTMGAALAAVEAAQGTIIEAKFEPDDSGKLSLSIYPAGKGGGVDAERNLFQEASGDPTAATFSTGLEVFHDLEHLLRSSRDLTLVQLSR